MSILLFALDYSRYPRGNTAPTVLPPAALPQMHYRYRGSTVHSVPSPRYYRIPQVIRHTCAIQIRLLLLLLLLPSHSLKPATARKQETIGYGLKITRTCWVARLFPAGFVTAATTSFPQPRRTPE